MLWASWLGLLKLSLPQDPGDIALARWHPGGPQRRGLQLGLGKQTPLGIIGGGLPAALPLPLEPVGGVLGLLLLLQLLLLLEVMMSLVMVVVDVVVAMAAVLRLLMLLEGGAIDGDEVGRRGHGWHRVGGVHLRPLLQDTSADLRRLNTKISCTTGREGLRLSSCSPYFFVHIALQPKNTLRRRRRRKYAGSCCSQLTRLSPALSLPLFSISALHALTLHCCKLKHEYTFLLAPGLTCHFFVLSLSSSFLSSPSSS